MPQLYQTKIKSVGNRTNLCDCFSKVSIIRIVSTVRRELTEPSPFGKGSEAASRENDIQSFSNTLGFTTLPQRGRFRCFLPVLCFTSRIYGPSRRRSLRIVPYFCILNFTLALCAFLSLPFSDRQKGAVFCLLLTSERQYPTRIFGRVLYLQATRG